MRCRIKLPNNNKLSPPPPPPTQVFYPADKIRHTFTEIAQSQLHIHASEFIDTVMQQCSSFSWNTEAHTHETSVQSSFHLPLTRSQTCWSWTDTFFMHVFLRQRNICVACDFQLFTRVECRGLVTVVHLPVLSFLILDELYKTVICDRRFEILPLHSSASLLSLRAAIVDWRPPQRVEAEGAGEEAEVPHCSPDVELESRPSAMLNMPGTTKGALLKDSKATDPQGFPRLLCSALI